MSRLVLDGGSGGAGGSGAGGGGGGTGWGAPIGKGIGTVSKTQSTAPVALAPVSGGGGGGGGAAAAVQAAPAALSLQDYINQAFPYVQQEQQNGLDLQNFDATTQQQQQQTQAQMDLQNQQLQDSLSSMGQNSAGDLASRGLLRSGLNFQAQDKIDQYGVQQHNGIAQELTDLLGQRAQGRAQQVMANNAALNAVISQLTGQFNQQNAVA